jgi:ribosomal protein S19
MRSAWKSRIPFVFDSFRFPHSRFSFLVGSRNEVLQPVCLRNSKFPSFLLGTRISVYNGFRLFSARIRPVMVGRYVGEFFFSKKIGASIHIPKKKKRKSRKS